MSRVDAITYYKVTCDSISCYEFNFSQDFRSTDSSSLLSSPSNNKRNRQQFDENNDDLSLSDNENLLDRQHQRRKRARRNDNNDSDDAEDILCGIDNYLENNNKELILGGQLGHAEFINNVIGDEIVCINTAKRFFYIWSNKRKLWVQDKNGIQTRNVCGKYLEEEITKHIIEENEHYNDIAYTNKKEKKQSEKRTNKLNRIRETVRANRYLSGVVDLVAGHQGANIYFQKKINATRDILSVKNGVIELKTGTLRARKKEDYLSYELDIVFDNNSLLADNNNNNNNNLGALGTFLNDIFQNKKEPQKVINWIQRYLGCTLTGEVQDQVFCLWLGSKGGNGKGVFDVVNVKNIR